MAGSLRRKHSGWELSVSAGRDLYTGQRRRISRYVSGSQRDAERELARLVLEVGSGSAAGTTATFADLVGTWIPTIAVRLSPKTVYDYERILDRVLLPVLGRIRLDELQPVMLDRLYAELLRSGPKGRPLSPNSVRKVHAVLRAALQQAVKWGWVPRNVAHMATPPPQRSPDVHSPAVADVRRLIQHAILLDGGPDFAELLWLAAVTGARRGELCGLRWDDVEPDRGVLHIRRGVVEVDSELVVRLPKTHQGRRLALDDGTFEMLRVRRLRLAEQALASGSALEPWVFPSTYGIPGPRAPESVSRQFRRLCDVVGVRVRFHDLRHFAATEALDAGIPLPTVSKRLGHRDTSTTANVYAHATTRADREAADVLGSLMRRALGGGSDNRRPNPADTAV